MQIHLEGSSPLVEVKICPICVWTLNVSVDDPV